MAETVFLLLVLANVILVLCVTALASCVPWLFWQCLRFHRRLKAAEGKVRTLDETLAAVIEGSGLVRDLVEKNGRERAKREVRK